MAISAGNTRLTVTLPTGLVGRLKMHQGEGQTFSDAMRQQLEQAYAGVEGQVMDLATQVAALRQDLNRIYALIEQMVKTIETVQPEKPVIEAALPMIGYDELYRTPMVLDRDMAVAVSEPPQERARWWKRST